MKERLRITDAKPRAWSYWHECRIPSVAFDDHFPLDLGK